MFNIGLLLRGWLSSSKCGMTALPKCRCGEIVQQVISTPKVWSTERLGKRKLKTWLGDRRGSGKSGPRSADAPESQKHSTSSVSTISEPCSTLIHDPDTLGASGKGCSTLHGRAGTAQAQSFCYAVNGCCLRAEGGKLRTNTNVEPW